jgi:DNA polymerase III subunit delta
VKLPAAGLPVFVAKPDTAIRAALVLARGAPKQLAGTMVPDRKDASRIADLAAAAMAADPARLHDETAALPHSGARGWCVVRVR